MKLNLPNKLTLLRIALVPVFMVFAALCHYGTRDFSRLMSFLAGTVFAAASITDTLDGQIARKRNLITDFGKFADPLADKMLTTAALIYMVVEGVCHPVILAIVMFREFAVAGVRMIAAANSKVIAANVWGKVKTIFQMVTVLTWYFLAAISPPDAAFAVILLTKLLLWAMAVVTVISGVKYLWDNRDCINTEK